MTGEHLPLEGIRIIDFTWVIAGPLTTRVFANLGADVIKIESRTRVDGIRYSLHSADRSSPNGGPLFNDCNPGKRSVAINLNRPEGVEIAKRLIAVSDIVVDNFSGSRMTRWGLGYEQLARTIPSLIMLSMPMMGSTGPFRDYRGNGNHVAALVGMNMSMGFEPRPPMGSDVAYPDFVNPYHASFALLVALHHRARTGEGQFIDLAQYESTAAVSGYAIPDYSVNGTDSSHNGNLDYDMFPHDVYECLPDDDGTRRWVAIAVRDDADWRALCRVLQQPEWALSEDFRSARNRRSHAEEIERQMRGWASQYDAHAAAQVLQGVGVPAGAAQDVRDLVDRDAHWSERQLDVISTKHGPMFCQAELIKFADLRIPSRPAPDLGEHTHSVLHDLLDLDPAEIERLEAAGVLE